MFNEFVDVAKIMQEIKLSTSQGRLVTSGSIEKDDFMRGSCCYDDSFYDKELAWRQDELIKYRQVIEEHKSVGTRTPKLLRFNRVSRGILKCTAKFVNKASMVITKDQNIVNHNLLISIDRLRESTTLLQQDIEDVKVVSSQYVLHVQEELLVNISQSSKLLKIDMEEQRQQITKLTSEVERLKQNDEKYKEVISKQDECIHDLLKKGDEYERQIELERVETRRLMQRLRNKFNEIDRKYHEEKQNKELVATSSTITPNESVKMNSTVSEEVTRIDSDLYYKEFEEKYRGTEEEIKKRLGVYISYLSKFRIYNCLDIGCGRGEWLQLLAENGYEVMGVDLNQDFVNGCKNKELNVKKQDALSFLRQCKDNSFDLISGFHIIEHIEVDELNQIIEECNRVLTPNGLIIFETPNPRNISVGSCNFYLDSTHIRPVHPERIKFQLEYFGFYNIEYVYWQQQNIEYVENLLRLLEATELHPAIKDVLKNVVQSLNCPGDYGIVGRKA